MQRRPDGGGTKGILRKTIVALLLFAPLVVSGQHGQQHHRDGSRHDGASTLKVVSPSEVSGVPLGRIKGTAYNKAIKDTLRDDPLLRSAISHDPSAIATLAPAVIDDRAVRAPPARLKAGKTTGLSSLLHARSLQDWEVEDFVLLATVDGTIHARDRKTGAPRWALEVDRPMIETTYHRPNGSYDEDYTPEDDFLWIVEPSQDGALYIYSPGQNAGLQKLGMTVKELVEGGAYEGREPNVMYVGEKKSTLYTVDARSGKIISMFSSAGSTIIPDESCPKVNGLEGLEVEECGSNGTLALGRTEYTVTIASRGAEGPICTLKYSEWGPNNRDSDLHNQYMSTMDKKYIYSRYDGSIFGFDHSYMDVRRNLFTQKLPSPVARVFDIARPTESDSSTIPLVILPQPIGPVDFEDIPRSYDSRDGRIFINRTETGGWYAMSEKTYPEVTGNAPQAQCYKNEWLHKVPVWEQINLAQQKDAFVGVHSLSRFDSVNPNFPTISGPEDNANDTPQGIDGISSSALQGPAVGNSRLIEYAAKNFTDIGLLLSFFTLIVYLSINRSKLWKLLTKKLDVERLPGVKEALMSPPKMPGVPSNTSLEETVNGEVKVKLVQDDRPKTPTGPRNDEEGSTTAAEGKGVKFEEPQPEDVELPASPPKKKKTHRGQRGGVNRKKGKKTASIDADMDNVEIIVNKVKEMDNEQALEPDVLKVNGATTNNVTDVSGPFQINNLVVTDNVLGYGSHGTIVYRGSFEGREVAVKRMLLEFYDVASHEVSLLQESDDHPNVIRYFCRQQSAGFLYIALELCPASLQDVVEKPALYTQLAAASMIDLPNVLYQIAAGVRYLHSLKIVHRDLKPQNILVAAPKTPRNNPHAKLPPRLLISDFGLCKKLDGDQSSFRATTAHAAGTSGWRAPELLVDDDTNPDPPSLINESGHSMETSEPAIIDTISNRRATRAIDIFSLGCVFFYILSAGNHPFGDRFMREANIIRDNYNLGELKRLGDSGVEAEHLIKNMLHHNPRSRYLPLYSPMT